MLKEPLKHQAYQMIKENIINCVYAPGAIINEELIREEINASRTPIRDALSRLEQEGLIKILPKKGIEISKITVKELNMVYETRYLLEPYVLKHYGCRIPQDTYLQYYRIYRNYLENPTEKEYSYEDMDDRFHKLLINSSDNSYFQNLYYTIENQIRRTRVITGRALHSRLVATIEEHTAIVEAALKNDWSNAAEAMLVHLNKSKDSMFEYIIKHEK